jgi:CrcB protein
MSLNVLWVFFGAGIGGALRMGVSELAARSSSPVPLGTLAVNVVGCLAVGVLMAFMARPGGLSDALRWFLVVGLLGGFTTFSAFGKETLELAMDGQMGRAALNVLLQNAVGLCAVWLGYSGMAALLTRGGPANA